MSVAVLSRRTGFAALAAGRLGPICVAMQRRWGPVRGLAAALCFASLPAAADTAFLRPQVVVDDATLRVQDIFENAGPRGNAPHRAAPQPGRRIVIEAPQLAAIARMHQVPWRATATTDRVVVERPGRAVPRAEVETLLREELTRQGLDEHAEIELPGWIAPMVPVASLHQAMLEGVVLEQPGNRFAATLVVMADGMATVRTRITGRAVPTVPVVIVTRRMALGERITARDIRETRQRAERVRPGMAERAEQVVGQELRRPLAADGGIPLADLSAPSIVQRNQAVVLVLDAPGITLTAQGRAMESGALVAIVPVMNLASRAVVEGEVIGPGRVRVAMGSTPVQRP
jgi:flagellar basal body P-ring formation protein FlgA